MVADTRIDGRKSTRADMVLISQDCTLFSYRSWFGLLSSNDAMFSDALQGRVAAGSDVRADELSQGSSGFGDIGR